MANLIETAKRNKDLKTLVKAIETAGLTSTLSGKGPYTVFAPNEDAFEGLPPGRLDELMEDKQELKRILKAHVVEGKMTASQLVDEGRVRTLEGAQFNVEKDGGVHIAKATVVQDDIRCDNGVCHVIDTVLLP